MKKFFSLLIALVLLVSMFALPTLALAQEATDPSEGEDTEAKREDLGLKFNDFIAQFEELVVKSNPGLYVEMNEKFQLSQEWIKDEEAVKDLFPGINYQLLDEEEEDDEEATEGEGAEDESQQLPTITFKLGDDTHENHAKEGATEPSTISRKAKSHIILPSAIEAEEDYSFAGWLVPVAFKGELLGDGEYYLYRAGDKFAMPESSITVIAAWYKTSETKPTYKYPKNDIICVEYCTPSDDPRDEHWERVAADSTINLQTAGWWMFRYVVVDGENGEVSDNDAVITSYDTKEFKDALESGNYTRESFCLKRYAVDTSNPKVALSSSMETKMEDGLTVGTSYTISTSLDITDSSSTTVTYVVYKNVGTGVEGADENGWILIYDSETREVTEGYETSITTGGAITPLSGDVTATGEYRYKVVYTVKDANGYFGVAKDTATELTGEVDEETGEFHPVLLLGVKLSTESQQAKERMAIWKIVLFVIAGLSAVGIVVLLVIKPKQAVEGDARVNSVSETKGDSSTDQSDKE